MRHHAQQHQYDLHLVKYHIEKFNPEERELIKELQRQDYEDRSSRDSASNSSYHQDGRKNTVMLMNVKPGVTLVNVISMLLVIANTTISATFLFFSIVYFLQSPTYFNLQSKDSASMAGDLIFYSYPFAIFFDFTSGYVYNVMGRRWTIFVGFMICCFIVVITPLFISTVFPGLLVCT